MPENPTLENTVWGCLADPDGDSYSNLVEMSMGTDPNVYDPPGLIGVEAHPPIVTILYPRANSFPAKFVHAEWSTDLLSWFTINVGETVRADLVNGKVIAASAYPSIPSRRLFMRLRIGP